MPYRIEFKPSAAKAFGKLPRDVQKRIGESVSDLAENPRPPGAEKMKGEDDLYRVRSGDYRVVYKVSDEVLLVLVVRVGHRREVYRGG